jgi:endoglycosylceramidase
VAILHGVNMVFKRPPYYPAATGFGKDDAAFLQRNGFNVVRLGVIYAGVEPSPGAYDDAYVKQISATESILAKHGVFSQLDFHQDMYNERFQGEGWPDWAVQDDGLANTQAGFPGNYLTNLALQRAFDHFWANDPGPGGVGLQDRYAAAWGHVASRFASAKHTVGFDLLNEPWPGTPWATCVIPTGCPAYDTGVMGPFYRRVLDRIRAVERQKLIWYEPNVLFNFGGDTNIPPLGDSSTGFSFHVYCTAGGGPVCDGFNERVFQNAEKHSAATGDALMVSEFGATDDLATIRSNIAQADHHMVSWEYWHYCECQDPTTTGSGTQAVVVDPALPPTGSNVKEAKLDVLSQPYPQLVAGTPQGWSFDPSTRVFQLTYSTRGPGGKKFNRRLRKPSKRALKKRQTEIFLGRARYPTGYRVSARGGAITSKPKTGVLKLIACPGRRRVRVTVGPSGSSVHRHVGCQIQPKRRG